jgi:hypothetical protein
MEYKISNFSIVTKALQILCKKFDCDFIDFRVNFDKSNAARLEEDIIYVPEGGDLMDTMAYIYSVYINSLGSICGRNIDNLESRNSLVNFFLSLLRDFKTEYGSQKIFDKDESIVMKLDQFHIVWMLLKNIFCPARGIPLQNIRVVAKCSNKHDVAVSVKNEKPFIYLNLDVEKNSVRSAFLLIESLRLLIKDNNSPESVIREVFSNYFMRDRLLDFLALVFDQDEEIVNFLATLSILCQSTEIEQLYIKVINNTSLKTAQTNPFVGNFWFLGLTEEMLDSVRGPDWSTTKSLKDFSKDLWDKVEVERKKRGMIEIPFEMLLRIQSEDLKVSPNQTLQGLLSQSRIW